MYTPCTTCSKCHQCVNSATFPKCVDNCSLYLPTILEDKGNLIMKLTMTNNDMQNVMMKNEVIIDKLQKKNLYLSREKKKVLLKVEVKLGTETEPEPKVVYKYDDKTDDVEPLIEPSSCYGRIEVVKINFIDYKSKHSYVLITVLHKIHEVIMILREDKLAQAKDCYDLFMKAKIPIKANKNMNKVKEALREALMSNLDGSIDMKALSGWDLNTKLFQSRDLYLDIVGIERLPIPIMNKSFFMKKPTKETFERYFEELTVQIRSPWDRLIVMILPYIAILRSVLVKYEFNPDFITNIVIEEDAPSDLLASWFQIYNRDNLTVTDIVKRDSEYRKVFSEICDDILLLDARDYPGESSYHKKRKTEIASSMAYNITERNALVEDTKSRFLPVIISNAFFDGDYLYRLIEIDYNEEVHRNFVKEQTLESIIFGFIQYVETHWKDIEETFYKDPKVSSWGNAIYNTILIVEKFFLANNMYIVDQLKLPTYDVKPEQWFQHNRSDSVSNITVLRVSLRKMSAQYTACSLDEFPEYHKEWVYYDEEWVLFPCEKLKVDFSKANKSNLLKYSLIDLKQEGLLRTKNSNVNYWPRQIDKVRSNFYCFKRSWLTQTGEADLIGLMKEEY